MRVTERYRQAQPDRQRRRDRERMIEREGDNYDIPYFVSQFEARDLFMSSYVKRVQ